MKNFLDIIVTFNDNFNFVDYSLILLINFLFIFIFYVLFSYSFKNKSQETKINTLLKLNLLLFIFYYVYKLIYYFEYDGSIAELIPLQLCNINIVLYFISLKTKNKDLLGFSFYTVVIGALLAILFSDNFLSGLSFAHPLALGFYFFHSFLILIALLSLKIEIFKPSVKNSFNVLKTLLSMSFVIFLVNIIFEEFIGIKSNYFYQTDATSVPQLQILYNFLPVKFLYLTPLILLMFGLMILIGSIYDIKEKIKERKSVKY